MNTVSEQVAEQQVEGFGNIFGAPGTPELDAPVRRSEAHRVTVDDVSVRYMDSGSAILKISVTSQDTGAQFSHDLWLPDGFADNVKVDPTALPVSENFAENQQGKYASTIHNSKGTATLDRYLAFAYAQGNTDGSAAKEATTLDSFAEALSGILTGTQLIVIRKPGKNNPDFLNITGINPIDDQANQKFINRLQKADVAIRFL